MPMLAASVDLNPVTSVKSIRYSRKGPGAQGLIIGETRHSHCGAASSKRRRMGTAHQPKHTLCYNITHNMAADHLDARCLWRRRALNRGVCGVCACSNYVSERIAARQSTRVIYTYPDFGGPTEIAFCEELGIHEEICVPELRAETKQRHVGFPPARQPRSAARCPLSGSRARPPSGRHGRTDAVTGFGRQRTGCFSGESLASTDPLGH